MLNDSIFSLSCLYVEVSASFNVEEPGSSVIGKGKSLNNSDHPASHFFPVEARYGRLTLGP